jgi:predicted DNA-binding mobile mystery protein A
MKKQHLAMKQLDRQLTAWVQARDSVKPKEGWIRTIRKTIGMTAKQLAKRLNVNRSRVVKIEQAEPQGALTMRTLQEVAEALNCKLVYALVPQISLRELIERQARKIAAKRLNRVSHSMLLEEQSVGSVAQQEQLIELINELLSGSFKNLWDEE